MLFGMSHDPPENDTKKDDESPTLKLEDEVNFDDFVEVCQKIFLSPKLSTVKNIPTLNNHLTNDNLQKETPPDQIIFPPEFNTFLRDRIRNLQSENGHLRQELDETRENFQNLQKSCETERLQKSEEAERKIFELSKRCKHHTAELETLRTKCKKLVDKMAAKETEMEEIFSCGKLNEKEMTDATTLTEEVSKSIPDEISTRDEQVRILNEKLAHTNAKLYETKNACTYLRQEVNKAQKLLCSEVGESVTIASLTNRPGGWRGRAQQLQQLQQKVFELQSRLNEHEKSTKSSSNFSISAEQRNVTYLKNLERERRQAAENSTRELRQAEIGLENCRKKLQAARARIKILENELYATKTNSMLLNEKRIHDDQLIEALNGQLGAVEEKFRERERIARNKMERAEESRDELRNELRAVNMQVDLFRKKLEERETEIETLRNGTEMRRKQEIVLQSPMTKIIEASSVEKPRDPKNSNEYVTMSLASEAERQRLLELVTLLNRRLDKERTDTDHVSELLRRERNKNARLETKFQRLEMERVGITRVDTGYRSKWGKSFVNSTSRENLNSDKIQYK